MKLQEVSGDSRSVAARRYAEMADKGASHVTLIREASLDSGLGGCLAIRQQLSGKAHAPLNKISMRRYLNFAYEAPHPYELFFKRRIG